MRPYDVLSPLKIPNPKADFPGLAITSTYTNGLNSRR